MGLFDRLGVKTIITPSGIKLVKKPLTVDKPFVFDFSSQPDMAQTFAVTSAMLRIPFRFTGLHSLKIKETDRLYALKTEMQKLGVLLEIHNDSMIEWKGDSNGRFWHSSPNRKNKEQDFRFPCNQSEKTRLATPSDIATYNDHRMAMAFAPVSFCTEKGICIADPEVVTKSYPLYWNDLKKANFSITPVGYPDCCGRHEICERNYLSTDLQPKIEYYDDEELDNYRYIAPDKHSESAINEFREVLYSMREQEVAHWLHSLQLRNIYLPDQLKTEALLIVNEQCNNR